jgi:hypothetical protein
MSRHHVKRHHWINGKLKTETHSFDTLEEAKVFAGVSVGDTIKIYNDNDEVVHQIDSIVPQTYA